MSSPAVLIFNLREDLVEICGLHLVYVFLVCFLCVSCVYMLCSLTHKKLLICTQKIHK